jgi:electron transport complex protein RnfG
MQNPLTTGSSVFRNSVILGVFAMFTVGLIAITQQGTAERIAEEKRRVQMNALTQILPEDQHENDLLKDTFMVSNTELLKLSVPAEAYRGRENGDVAAVILPVVAPDGYSGRIDLLVGIRANGDIAGVRVTSHRETPGLGDKVELAKSNWILEFNGKSLTMPAPENWGVRKDGGAFDQFVGATITPRAVVQAVYRTLQYFEENRAMLLELPAKEPTNG